MCLLGDSIIDFHCSCPDPNESNPRITVPRLPPPTLISVWLTILSTTVVREIRSAETLKLNFSLYTGLRLLRLTRVLALDMRAPSQYRASLTYGSRDKIKQKYVKVFTSLQEIITLESDSLIILGCSVLNFQAVFIDPSFTKRIFRPIRAK